MYCAFFDESGHPDDTKYLVVAGGLASVEQWVHFEREWREALAPFGTEIFHAKDFSQRKPPFHEISLKQSAAILERLAGIICRRMEKIFSFTVNMHHYRAMNAKYVFAECYGYPYPLAARSCIGGIQSWAKTHSVPVQDILFFFEDGAHNKGQLEWIAERDALPIPLFKNKRESIPLQIGDFVAWHGMQCINGQSLDKPIQAVMRRLESMSHYWRELDMSDPDRLPALLEIPERDPALRYQCKVLQKHGVRRALVHYWPKDNPAESKIDRKTLVLPKRKTLRPEDLDRALQDYTAKKAAKDQDDGGTT